MKRLLVLSFVDFISLAILTGLLFGFSKIAFGYEILQPESVMLEGEQYENLRDPYLPEDSNKWVYGAALAAKFTLLGKREQSWRLFYDPRLSFRSTTSQIREGALNYETGAEANYKQRGVRVFKRHESRHGLERDRPNQAYPLLDSVVVQLEWRFK